METVKRGYVPNDRTEFGYGWTIKMRQAGEELYYLLNRGYDMKSAGTFIGNHYQLSERQRQALSRIVAPENKLAFREQKEIKANEKLEQVYIDGFNTIINLEVALSGSLLLQGMDGAIRDLAGLRGTYKIMERTAEAIDLMFRCLDELGARETIIYLDRPVSNSGRLGSLLYEVAVGYKRIFAEVKIIQDVDQVLQKKEHVISSDSAVLDHCGSWYNLNRQIIMQYMPSAWLYDITDSIERIKEII